MADTNQGTDFLNKTIDFAVTSSHTVGDAVNKVVNGAIDASTKYGPQAVNLFLQAVQFRAVMTLIIWGFVALLLSIIFGITSYKTAQNASDDCGKGFFCGLIAVGSGAASVIWGIASLVHLLDYTLWVQAINPKLGVIIMLLDKVVN